MKRTISIEDALGKIEKLHSLSERKYKETESKRLLAINELSRKIRASLNALLFIPCEKYDVLCAPTNLLYRSMITDLMTLLLISQVNDKQLDEVINLFDIDFARALKNALKANIEIRKDTYPDDIDAFDEQAKKYQEKLYDDLQDCLTSAKGEDWEIKPKTPVIINRLKFNGSFSQIYDILKSYKEVAGYAYLYQFYRLFSQSEHFSMKGRIINHKQTFHEEYYNKVRYAIYVGAVFLYNKYN